MTYEGIDQNVQLFISRSKTGILMSLNYVENTNYTSSMTFKVPTQFATIADYEHL